MKKLLYIFLTVLIVGCSGEDKGGNNYPSLRVVNQTTDSDDRNIVSVKLLNYEFTYNLILLQNNEQIFILDNGMPGGYENINIEVRLSGPQLVIRNIDVTFNVWRSNNNLLLILVVVEERVAAQILQ